MGFIFFSFVVFFVEYLCKFSHLLLFVSRVQWFNFIFALNFIFINICVIISLKQITPTQDKMACFHILKTWRKHSVAYILHVSGLWKHGYLVFHVCDTFLPCFHTRNERSCFHHIPVITFAFFLVSVTFLVTYISFLFLTQDRMINILSLWIIKVYNGKFLLSRLVYEMVVYLHVPNQPSKSYLFLFLFTLFNLLWMFGD